MDVTKGSLTITYNTILENKDWESGNMLSFQMYKVIL